MKKILILFVLIACLIPFTANATKMTDLTEETSPDTADLLWLTINVSTSAADRKVTLGNLLLWMATQDWTITGTWDMSGATITFPTSITADLVGDVTGNASTATALAANPDPCTAGSYVSDIAADGTLTCANPLDNPTIILADDSTFTFPATVPTGLLRADAGAMNTTSSIADIDISGGTASTVAVWDASQKLTSLSTQNVITTGYIDGGILVTKSTAATVTVLGMSGYYVNADDDVIEFDLPADPTNKGYCFANTLYAKAITVDPDNADYIIMDGVAGAAGESVVSTGAADEQLCVIGIDSSYWKVTSKVGTWAQETPP